MNNCAAEGHGCGDTYQLAGKVIFCRLLKNAHMQGASFDRLRINSPEE
jgi:hypothetical protein